MNARSGATPYQVAILSICGEAIVISKMELIIKAVKIMKLMVMLRLRVTLRTVREFKMSKCKETNRNIERCNFVHFCAYQKSVNE